MKLLVGLFVNLWLLVWWPWRRFRAFRAAPRGAFLKLVVAGPIVEVGRKRRFWQRRGPAPLSLHRLRELVELAARDPRVRGLLVELEELSGGGARAQSLREILSQFRATGKELVAYLPRGGSTRLVYVASAAGRVILGPETQLAPLGFAVEARYLKELLAKLGVEPEVYARGQYKTAAEFLVAERMSDPQRRQLEALLDASFAELMTALTERGVDREQAGRWIDDGPWSAAKAVECGLADGIAYPDEVLEQLAAEGEDKAPVIGAGSYLRRRKPKWRKMFRGRRIAVVEVHGAIVSKTPGGGAGASSLAVDSDVIEALDEAREDPRISGVVIHVDSRGGSALASDRMLHATKRLAAEKPVVTYMGDVAASGGYMVAVGTPHIVAQPTTITGSIGVIAARIVVGGVAARLGVATEVVKRGARADMESPFRHLGPAEATHFREQIEESYQGFLAAVAEGRGRSVEEIEELAQGRVYSGRDAESFGLVDTLGGFDSALARLRERIGKGAERLQPEVLGSPPTPSLLSLLGGALRAEAQHELGPLLELSGVSRLAEDLRCARALSSGSERTWFWCNAVVSDL